MFALCFTLNISAVNDTIYKNITVSDIKQRFTQNKMKNFHPRLFFNNGDIVRIKALIDQKDKLATLGFNQLKVQAEWTMKRPFYTYQLDKDSVRIYSIHDFSTLIPSLVLMYHLTGEKRYADHCIRQMELMAAYPDFGAERHFLDTGIAGFNFAFVYDGLYDYLTRKQKKLLKDAVMKKVLMPALLQMNQPNNWWHNINNNWNGVCHGGLIMAGLAMYEDDRTFLSEIIAQAANSLPNYINTFNPDGQCVEGMSYWTYGLLYTSISMESMDRVLGTIFGLDQIPGFKKTGWFPIFFSGPVVSLNVGDDGIKTQKEQSYFWFAKHYMDDALAKIQYDLCLKNRKISWSDFLYYDPAQIERPSTEKQIPTEIYFPANEFMSLRDNWSDDAFYIAMFGKKNVTGHSHLDAGSFYIQATGEVWAYGNLGNDDYGFPGYFTQPSPKYFDAPSIQKVPGRWHMYRLRAEGKNCLVFNPGVNPDQNDAGVTTLIDRQTDSIESSFTLNLTDCYKRDVRSYTRKIQLNKSTKVITVLDEYETLKPAEVWWGMHTKAKITLSEDLKTASLQLRKKQMTVSIKSPADAIFQVLKAEFLPGVSLPLSKNSANTQFRKLSIKMDNQTSNTIRVEFSKATF